MHNGFDRIPDNQKYKEGKMLFMYTGCNFGKNCGSQGTNNNMFQNENTFRKFVQLYSERFGLKDGNEINDNVVIYVRCFLENLVNNYENL